MTPKVAAFLRDSAPPTPCLVLDLDRVEENYRRLKAAMPLARIYYAVKANPAAPVLDRLVGLGSCFDAASFEEVAACLDAGAAPEQREHGVPDAPGEPGGRIPAVGDRTFREYAQGFDGYCFERLVPRLECAFDILASCIAMINYSSMTLHDSAWNDMYAPL